MTTATTKDRLRLTSIRGLLLAGGILLIAWLAYSPLRIWLSLRAAQQSLNAGQAETAIRQLADARQLAPQNAELAFWQARAYRKAGRVNDVESALNEAKRAGLDPDLVEREWLLTLAQSGRITEAEPYLPRLLQTAGEDAAEICEAFVRGYQIAFRFEAAAALLDAWQQDCPDSPSPHALRGGMAQMATRWPLAVEEYRQAIDLGDDTASTRLGLALSLMEMQEFQAAVAHFERAVEMEPHNLDARLGLAASLMKLSHHKRAARAYHQALELDPDSFDAHLGLARLDLAQGRPEQAIARLQPLLAVWPNDAGARYTIAQSLMALGREEEANRHLAEWEAADEAIQRLEELLEDLKDDPANIAMRYEIGKLLVEHYSRPMGEKYLLSVLQLAPGHAPAHAALADFYTRSQEPDRAQEHARWSDAVDVSKVAEPAS